MSEAGAGPRATILKRPFQFRESFVFSTIVGALSGALAGGGSGVADPGPAAYGETG